MAATAAISDDRAVRGTGGGPRTWGRAVLRLITRPGRARRRGHGGPPRRVAVLHSDIVGSTRLVEAAGHHYPRLLVRHRRLIEAAVRRRGGRFLAYAGDGTLATFDQAEDAVVAAVEAQRALGAEPWPRGFDVRVRMGVHAGPVQEVAGEPVGLAVNLGARVMAAAEAGQVLVSTTAAAAGRTGLALAPGIAVRDAGWHVLDDHAGRVRLNQVVADGVTVTLPPVPAEQVEGQVPVA
jgi:class 3 adenylate cyclase